jgi:hypothetical protein
MVSKIAPCSPLYGKQLPGFLMRLWRTVVKAYVPNCCTYQKSTLFPCPSSASWGQFYSPWCVDLIGAAEKMRAVEGMIIFDIMADRMLDSTARFRQTHLQCINEGRWSCNDEVMPLGQCTIHASVVMPSTLSTMSWQLWYHSGCPSRRHNCCFHTGWSPLCRQYR